jgi:hypothetical protein
LEPAEAAADHDDAVRASRQRAHVSIVARRAVAGYVLALCQLRRNSQKDTFGRCDKQIERGLHPSVSELSMPRIRLLLALVVAGAVLAVPFAHGATSSVVVSQIFAGGGNAGASYTNDFVELFNRGSAAVDLTG